MKGESVAFWALGIAFEPSMFYGYSKRWRFVIESVDVWMGISMLRSLSTLLVLTFLHKCFNTVLSSATMPYPSIEEYPTEALNSIITSQQQLPQ